MGRTKAGIPDRWEEYKPLGQRIPETRIICCKCPLKEELCRKLPSKSKWFTPQTLFSMLNEENLKLGLVIDLTNTDRYYNPNAFTYADVGYVKIFTPGHDVPAEDAIKKFCDAIKTYEKGVDDKDRVIIVHCTHGVNRTGYLVCHYLIECCGWSYEKAFQAFNLARDHKIERENYLAALMELDNKVNNKPHIFLHDDASDEETTPKKIGTKGRRSNSISSTSSDDSLFKPHKRMPVVVAPVVAMTGSAQVAPLPDALLPPGGMAPAAAANVPFFNPAIMQGLLMNVAHMQQAMMAGRLPPGPPLTVPPAFQTTLPKKPSVSSSSESSDESESTSSTSGSSSSDLAENASDTLANEERIRENAAGTIGWPVEGPSQMDDEEDDQGQPSPADWNLGGKVQLKKKSAAQKRRERQKRTAQMHRTLQSGQFWKIREMQKEKYGF